MNAPRFASRPEPGFFKTRLVRGGPYVPARIFREPAVDPLTGEVMERPCLLQAEIAGRACDPERVWHFAWPIEEAEYRYLVATAAWAERHAPSEPAANPGRAIDLNDLPPLF